MRGISCLNDTGCPGSTCDTVTKTCRYTHEDLLGCWADEMPSEVKASLYDLWRKIPTTREDFIEDIRSVAVNPNGCTGRDALLFQKHYSFVSLVPSCRDQCYNPQSGISFCLPFAFLTVQVLIFNRSACSPNPVCAKFLSYDSLSSNSYLRVFTM